MVQVGIISYLPDEQDKRAKRIKFLKNEVQFIREVYPDKTINIVAQNWGDYRLDDTNINYIISSPVGVSGARNILMRNLYQSKDDYILLMDDDMAVYDYYGCYDFFREIDKNSKKFLMIDMLTAINPVYIPFKKRNYEDKLIQTHWKFTKRDFNTAQQITFIKNIKKYYDKELYYTIPTKLPFHEDTDWHIRWAMEGFTCYTCEQIILKDPGNNYSTQFTSNRAKEEKLCAFEVIKRFPFANQMIKNGRIYYNYLRQFNKTKPIGYVKRELPYYYTEKEIPK